MDYVVSRNIGNDTLHGGFKGWNSKIWESVVRNNSLVMSLLSDDNDEGFPGAVIATVIFKFTNNGELVIEMKACTTKATPINLTNHSYFNLAGQVCFDNQLCHYKLLICHLLFDFKGYKFS